MIIAIESSDESAIALFDKTKGQWGSGCIVRSTYTKNTGADLASREHLKNFIPLLICLG